MFKNVVSSVAALFAMLTFLVPNTISATAQESAKSYVVTAKGGLNVRDKNCNKKNVAPFRAVVYTDVNAQTPREITCTIQNRKIKLIPIYNKEIDLDGYVARNWLTEIQGFFEPNLGGYSVVSKGGVNLRNKDCKRLVTIPYGTIVENSPSTNMPTSIVCLVNGTYYNLVLVKYKNTYGYVASKFLSKLSLN